MKKLFTVVALILSAAGFAQNVGIGETTPTESKLQVKNTDSSILLIQNTATPNGTKTGLFYKSDGNYSGSIATVKTAAQTYRMGLYTFGGLTATTLKERLSILDNGNVGIGTITPTTKLEVAGTVKIADGTQGADKVLTSDAAGNASWQSLGATKGYKYCKQITAAGAGSFTVPAGVTEIMVEAWGGGSGGVTGNVDRAYGGSSGGYVRTVQTVTPGAVLSYSVGAGSADAAENVTVLPGGNTTFTFTSGNIQAFGGGGHSANSINVGPVFSGTGTVDNFIALYGNTGSTPVYQFGQKSSTIFTQIIHGGNGGVPVGLIGATPQRGFIYYYENGVLLRSYGDSFSVFNFPSSGAFGSTGGSNGGGDGMILIWYN